MEKLTADDIGELPDDDIEIISPNEFDERNYWVFVSHTAQNYEFIKGEVVSENPHNFFLLNYRAASKTVVEAYKRQIMSALSRCAWFVLAASEAATKSKWVRFEVNWAIKYRKPNRMLILMLEDCDVMVLHNNLKGIGVIDFRGAAEEGRRDLRAAIPDAFRTDVPFL